MFPSRVPTSRTTTATEPDSVVGGAYILRVLFDGVCVVCAGPGCPLCESCCESLVPAHDVVIDGLDGCRAAFRLDETSREAIAAFKYRHERRIARWLAEQMYKSVPLAVDQITWIPTTSERRHRRGYDQARELGLALSRLSGAPAGALLGRRASDARQTGQSRVERLTGPELQIRGPAPDFVVLVDDIVTTGSSLRVAAKLLRQAGATRVVGLVGAATPLTNPQIGSSIPSWK